MNDNNKPIGLITYHSAYNFGSVLQTYGTIRALEKLGYSVETIDYRTPSQTFWYQTDFSIKKGLRSMIDNFGFLFIKAARKRRAQKYENFISRFLNPTNTQFKSYEQIKKTTFDYDVLISGSDQVWNISCGEFQFEAKEAILPYFLQFGNPKRKIAFSSSFGNQTLRNIRKYKELLCQYDALSTREPIIREYIQQATGRDVELVCDPTWLLDKYEWKSLDGVYKPDIKYPYIFVYALYWNFRTLNKWIPKIKELAKRYGMVIYCVTPLNYYRDKDITIIQDAGPLDILSYLINASLVITNTFHGTIFSINFEIPFYSCCVNPGSRQGQILAMCGLEDRIINSPSELLDDNKFDCDFTKSTNIIKSLRNHSIEYLKKEIQTNSK